MGLGAAETRDTRAEEAKGIRSAATRDKEIKAEKAADRTSTAVGAARTKTAHSKFKEESEH